MIVEWFLGLAAGVVEWMASLINGWSPPGWLVGIDDSISAVTDIASGLGVWVNWGIVGLCTAAVAASWALFGNVKLARVGVSHIPQFGGGGN